MVKTSVTAHELIVVKTCPLHGGSRTDMGNPVQGTSPIIGGTGYPNGKSKDQGIRMLPLYGRCTGISYNMSYIGTARKHGINPYEAIRSAISGNPDIIFD